MSCFATTRQKHISSAIQQLIYMVDVRGVQVGQIAARRACLLGYARSPFFGQASTSSVKQLDA